MKHRSLLHFGLAAALCVAGAAGAASGPASAGRVKGFDGGLYLPYKPSVVRETQRELTQRGFYHGAIDGKLGSETMHAIGSFQKEHGLAMSGVPTPRTRHALATS